MTAKIGIRITLELQKDAIQIYLDVLLFSAGPDPVNE